MVSIYSSRLVYAFQYTIRNGNVIASFVQRNKDFVQRNKEINPLFPLVRNCTHLAWTLPSPFVHTYYVDDHRGMLHIGIFVDKVRVAGVSLILLHLTVHTVSSSISLLASDCSNSGNRIFIQNHLNCVDICCHKFLSRNILSKWKPTVV